MDLFFRGKGGGTQHIYKKTPKKQGTRKQILLPNYSFNKIRASPLTS